MYTIHILLTKSNRLKILLSENSKSPAESIRGAKFIWEPDEDGKEIQKHVFTHYVSLKAIERAIDVLSETISVLKNTLMEILLVWKQKR